MLRKYETVLIIKPDLPEEQFEALKARAITAIVSNGGHEIAFQDWGKKRLAYPIKKIPKGNYLYFRYLSDGAAVVELERNLKVLDPMLRFLTVKLAERVDPETFDFEGEHATIFPFGVKPREPVAEPAPEGTEDGVAAPEAAAAAPEAAAAVPEAAAAAPEAVAAAPEAVAAEAVAVVEAEETPAEKPKDKAAAEAKPDENLAE